MKAKLLPGLLLTFTAIAMLFTTCKKEKKPTPPIYGIAGDTFTLASYQTNFGIGVNATAARYECMAYNTLTFFRDSTSSSAYSGLDSCYITPRVAGAQVYGIAGTLPLASTWHQIGNTIAVLYSGNTKPVYGIINSVNGQLQIAFKDTVPSNGKSYYINSLEVQQQ